MLSLFERNKNFRKKVEPMHPRYELHKLANEILKATLGAGDLREAVKVPEGYDVDDWMSVMVVDLFNQVNLIYGSMCDGCTEASCPTMNAGPKFEYRWQDNDKYKTATRLSAPKYIEVLMEWVDRQLSDDAIFPAQAGQPFPDGFKSTVKTIMRRLFRVYAHIYHSHLDEIMRYGAEAHLSTCFRHFMYFVQELNLLPAKELEPLREIVSKL